MENPLDLLIQELTRLPGIGEKTATRLAFHMLRAPKHHADTLAHALQRIVREMRFCEICQNITNEELCQICKSPARDQDLILVVEGPQELRLIEQGKSYRGLYHVLHGALSPLDRIGPDQIKIKELLMRLHRHPTQEVILATSTRVEGEATALYLMRLLKPLGLRLTRLATGIPVGGDLEYLDVLTLQKAIEGRKEV